MSHDQGPDQAGGNAPRGGVGELLHTLAAGEGNVLGFREILPEIMRGSGLDRLAVLHHRLDRQGHVRSRKTFVLRFLSGDHRDGEVVAQELLVKPVDHPRFLDRLGLRFMRRVPLLPEELGGSQEQARPHFPTHHVRPLVDQQRQIAVGLHPAGEGGANDRLGGRPDHVWLRQLTGRNHFCFPRLGIFHRLQAMMRHHRAFRREALRVLRLLFKIGQRDQQREISVLMPRRLEAAVKLLLDQLPDAVAPRLDHHAAPRLRVLREVGGLDHLLVPLGKILFSGGGNGGLFGGHDGAPHWSPPRPR